MIKVYNLKEIFVQDIYNSLMAGDITIVNGIIWYVIALLVGAIGGAIGGIVIGGKHMGNELAAMMGAFFGPIAAAPGVLVGLIVLAFI